MIFYHIATAADWQAARESGSYRTSTRGRTIADEGFMHGSFEAQVPVVANKFYGDVTEPLVLLRIDAALCGAEVLVEEVPGAGEFPHLYGDLVVTAVVATTPYERDPVSGEFGAVAGLPDW